MFPRKIEHFDWRERLIVLVSPNVSNQVSLAKSGMSDLNKDS